MRRRFGQRPAMAAVAWLLLGSCGPADSSGAGRASAATESVPADLPGSAPDATGVGRYSATGESFVVESGDETYEVMLSDQTQLVGSDDAGECVVRRDAARLDGEEVAVWHTGSIEDSEPQSVEGRVVAVLGCVVTGTTTGP